MLWAARSNLILHMGSVRCFPTPSYCEVSKYTSPDCLCVFWNLVRQGWGQQNIHMAIHLLFTRLKKETPNHNTDLITFYDV